MIFRINNSYSACMIALSDEPQPQLMGYVFPMSEDYTPEEDNESEIWIGWV